MPCSVRKGIKQCWPSHQSYKCALRITRSENRCTPFCLLCFTYGKLNWLDPWPLNFVVIRHEYTLRVSLIKLATQKLHGVEIVAYVRSSMLQSIKVQRRRRGSTDVVQRRTRLPRLATSPVHRREAVGYASDRPIRVVFITVISTAVTTRGGWMSWTLGLTIAGWIVTTAEMAEVAVKRPSSNRMRPADRIRSGSSAASRIRWAAARCSWQEEVAGGAG